MSTLQDTIAKKFLDSLKEIKEVEPHVVEQLQALLDAGGKPKVDALVKIFTSPPDQEAK